MENPVEQEDASVWDSNPARVADMLSLIADAVSGADDRDGEGGAYLHEWLGKIASFNELQELAEWLRDTSHEWEHRASPEEKAAYADWLKREMGYTK